MADQGRELAGVVGFYDDAPQILEAMRKLHAENYASIDSFTPFPIHGMDDAMGIKRSILPYIAFCAGVTGCILGFSFQYWTSAVDWPINVGGKPFNSWPAFIPVTFELTILFTGLSTVFGMFALNRLPNVTKKAFDSSITKDRFALFIEATEGKGKKSFNESEAQSFLQGIGAKDVQKVYSEGWF